MSLGDIWPDTHSLTSCINLCYQNNRGTGFLVHHEEAQYLVTAKHVVQGMMSGDNFGIRQNNTWIYVRCENIITCPEGADLAVIIAENTFHENFASVGFDCNNIDHGFVGQSVVYLGYPLGWSNEFAVQSTDSAISANSADNASPNVNLVTHHLPFAKKGILGGISRKEHWGELYIDSLNNQGFSGGPAIINTNHVLNRQSVRLLGVIVGYKYDAVSNVYTKRPDGETTIESNMYVLPNSGYAIAITAGRILELIDMMANSNPQGA